MEIEFTTQVFKEGKLYVAYTPELDVSSCGGTENRARRNLLEAVRLLLEEKMGTLRSRWRMPRLSPVSWKAPARVFELEGSPARERRTEYAAVPVFVIKNNLRTAGLSRERYFEFLRK